MHYFIMRFVIVIKMLAIDLDETLLHTDKTISAFTKAVLGKASAAGIKVVIASARPIRAVKQVMVQIQSDAIICHNGAVIIVNGEKAGCSYRVPIKEASQLLLSLQSKYPGKKLSVEIDDMIYANFDGTVFWGKTDKDRQMLRESAVQTDFSDLPAIDADKVIVELGSEEEYQEILAQLSPSLYGQLSDGGKLCLIMNRNASKFNAIKRLAAQWGISITDIAAFGDDLNDVEMLMHCGTGVAMKNAIPEAILAANTVTETNNDDGVAKYIESNIL
jgi:hypothetical protein